MLCYMLKMSLVDKLSATEWTSLHNQNTQEILAILLLWKVAFYGSEQTTPQYSAKGISEVTSRTLGGQVMCLGGQDMQGI